MKSRFKKYDYLITNPRFRSHCESNYQNFFAPYSSLYEIYEMLPKEHLWRFDTEYSIIPLSEEPSREEFESHFNEVSNAYMNDFRAAVLCLAWKSEELTVSAVQAINQENYLSASILARAALEATVGASVLYFRLCSADKDSRQSGDSIKYLNSLHENSRRILWGRKKINEAPVIPASNIMNQFETFKKHAFAEPLTEKYFDQVYEFLSNIAHPSADGHQIFWKTQNLDYENNSMPHWIELSNKNSNQSLELDKYIFSIAWALTYSSAKLTRIWQLLDDLELKNTILTKDEYRKYKQESFRPED
jgi:hypothetical protein